MKKSLPLEIFNINVGGLIFLRYTVVGKCNCTIFKLSVFSFHLPLSSTCSIDLSMASTWYHVNKGFRQRKTSEMYLLFCHQMECLEHAFNMETMLIAPAAFFLRVVVSEETKRTFPIRKRSL